MAPAAPSERVPLSDPDVPRPKRSSSTSASAAAPNSASAIDRLTRRPAWQTALFPCASVMKNVLLWAGAAAVLAMIYTGLAGRAPAAPSAADTAPPGGADAPGGLGPIATAASTLASAVSAWLSTPAPNAGSVTPGKPLFLTAEKVARIPHNPSDFLQGFEVHDGILFESTGLYGKSRLFKRDLATGEEIRSVTLSAELFGEGLTVWNGIVYVLTWKSRRAFSFDATTLALVDEWALPRPAREGWGLTHDDDFLVLSDGTASIFFIDPADKTVHHRIEAHVFQQDAATKAYSRRKRQSKVNELEFVPCGAPAASAGGTGSSGSGSQLLQAPPGRSRRGWWLFANIWYQTDIAVIDPETGQIVAWVDARALKAEQPRSADVLNGVAWDAQREKLYLSGKMFSWIYEVSVPCDHQALRALADASRGLENSA